MSRQDLAELTDRPETLRTHLERVRGEPKPAHNEHGEVAMQLASGHDGDPDLFAIFTDYDPNPREYELSLARTVLRVHTRVADFDGRADGPARAAGERAGQHGR